MRYNFTRITMQILHWWQEKKTTTRSGDKSIEHKSPVRMYAFVHSTSNLLLICVRYLFTILNLRSLEPMIMMMMMMR